LQAKGLSPFQIGTREPLESIIQFDFSGSSKGGENIEFLLIKREPGGE
jgi:hypothetical protein